MSAPRTDIEKQARRHRGPLIGMVIVVLFGLALMVFWWGGLASKTDPRAPNDAATTMQTDPSQATPQTEGPASGQSPAN